MQEKGNQMKTANKNLFERKWILKCGHGCQENISMKEKQKLKQKFTAKSPAVISLVKKDPKSQLSEKVAVSFGERGESIS